MKKPTRIFATDISNNKMFLLLTEIYLAVLLFVSILACFFSYYQKKQDIISAADITYAKLEQEYTDTIENFWQIYMPIFEQFGSIHDIMSNYFSSASVGELSHIEKNILTVALKQMMLRDSKVKWIALYSDYRKTNYILFSSSSSLTPLPEDFPYMEKIQNKSLPMEVWGTETLTNGTSDIATYAICGGVPANMGTGKIIAGYSITPMEDICKGNQTTLKSLVYLLTSNHDILFDSSDSYRKTDLFLPDRDYQEALKVYNGRLLSLNAKICGTKNSVLSYQISSWEIFFHSHRYTPAILFIVLIFALLSIFIYTLMLRFISREVHIIQHGLEIIGENHLDYSIPTDFKQSGLPEIASSINSMTKQLNDNINRAYYYELKQKEAELSELQAKFNPHFLYNSLEMLRSRCYQNGDSKTADLISQLAAIFRGFIGSANFIPLRDELTFSKRYLALFGARYGNQVQILYDIDSELLQYGIIRNVFQPLIENYFVHGFEPSAKVENYICFRGKSIDKNTMMLTVEDNGLGMTQASLEQLNEKLHEPIKLDTESYGLKNLHQRLSLFYGENCGLTLARNGDRGLCIQMTVRKLTCAEYEASKLK